MEIHTALLLQFPLLVSPINSAYLFALLITILIQPSWGVKCEIEMGREGAMPHHVYSPKPRVTR